MLNLGTFVPVGKVSADVAGIGIMLPSPPQPAAGTECTCQLFDHLIGAVDAFRHPIGSDWHLVEPIGAPAAHVPQNPRCYRRRCSKKLDEA